MSVNVVDSMNKFQEEGLKALKQTQEASLHAMQTFRELGKEWNEKPGTFPAFENMPTPTQLVEMSFGFASQLLEMRKTFTLQVAEMIADAQKQVQANIKSATAAPADKQHAK
jgi:hypothetical protein